MRKRQLEKTLSQLSHSPSPKIAFEAYDLDPIAATELLFLAEEKYHDIAGRSIIDLGCGSGILAIGAALLGSKEPLGIDIDRDSIWTARENAARQGVHLNLVVGDIGSVIGTFDTSVMNPPFGTRTRGADVIFLEKAIELAKVTYSLHKRSSESREFLLRTISNMGARVDAIFELTISIPKTYKFHRQKGYQVAVDLYRITK